MKIQLVITEFLFIDQSCLQFFKTNNLKVFVGDCVKYNLTIATLDENLLINFRDALSICIKNGLFEDDDVFKFNKLSNICPSYVFYAKRYKEKTKVFESCGNKPIHTKTLCALTDDKENENKNTNVIVAILTTAVIILLVALFIISFKLIKVF